MTPLPTSSVFEEAAEDLRSIGIHISQHEHPGSKPYAIIGGRSNARWWLVPLSNGFVAEAGLALFQPLFPAARLMKQAAAGLSRIGLQSLWARNRAFLQIEPQFQKIFPFSAPLSFSFFTGTYSPHRKVAIQVMTTGGEILGFAKLTRSPAVAKLLQHEAMMLQKVKRLNLAYGHTPTVLFSGDVNGSEFLLTDTLKTKKTASVHELSTSHRAFLQEIQRATISASSHPLDHLDLDHRIQSVAQRVGPAWQAQLLKSLDRLKNNTTTPIAMCLSQGDFTPWNVFDHEDILYVFDWEYANLQVVGFDFLHFTLNQTKVRNLPAKKKLSAAKAALSEEWLGLSKPAQPLVILTYILSQILLQTERIKGPIGAWDGQDEHQHFLELLTNPKTPTGGSDHP